MAIQPCGGIISNKPTLMYSKLPLPFSNDFELSTISDNSSCENSMSVTFHCMVSRIADGKSGNFSWLFWIFFSLKNHKA